MQQLDRRHLGAIEEGPAGAPDELTRRAVEEMLGVAAARLLGELIFGAGFGHRLGVGCPDSIEG
jgi:hypothetical protein